MAAAARLVMDARPRLRDEDHDADEDRGEADDEPLRGSPAAPRGLAGFRQFRAVVGGDGARRGARETTAWILG